MANNKPTHRDVLSLLTGAWVHFGRSLAAGSAISFVAVAAWQQDTRWFQAVIISGLAWLFFAFFHAFECTRSRCAVCTGPLFKRTTNVKHSTARRFLGSFELWTALRTILTVGYRCQHCGTEVFCHHREKSDPLSGHRAYRRHTRLPPQQVQGKAGIVLQTRITIPPRRRPVPEAQPAADPRARS